MKSLKTLLTCGMLLASTAAFAQFSNAGGGKSTSSRSGSGLVKKTDSYSRFYVGYNPTTISYDIKGKDDFTMPGVSLGFTHGFSLSKSLPLFLEVGLKGTFNFKSEKPDEDDDDYDYAMHRNLMSTRAGYWDYDDDDYDDDDELKIKHKYASISVPVNLAYKLSFGNGDVSLTPFFGITLKANVMSKDEWVEGDEKEKYDNFDKKDVGKDSTWKRFQAGWQVGANLDYKQLAIGFHYGSDFGELCKKTTTSNWGISLGCNF